MAAARQRRPGRASEAAAEVILLQPSGRGDGSQCHELRIAAHEEWRREGGSVETPRLGLALRRPGVVVSTRLVAGAAPDRGPGARTRLRPVRASLLRCHMSTVHS